MAQNLGTFVGKVMSLLFNMLSRLVITFFPRSKYLLISWLQSPSAVIFDPWVGKIPWKRAWLLTPIFLPGESPWTEELGGLQSTGHKESDTTERLHFHFHYGTIFAPIITSAFQFAI